MWVRMCHGVHVKVRGQPEDSLSFYYVGSQDWIWVLKLDGKHLYLPLYHFILLFGGDGVGVGVGEIRSH